MKRALSALPRRRNPSAILAGIETAARRICCDNPYVSVLGKPAVNAYTASTNSCAFRHTNRSRKLRATGLVSGIKTRGVQGSKLQVSNHTGGSHERLLRASQG